MAYNREGITNDLRAVVWKTEKSHTGLGCSWEESSGTFHILRAHFP